jgi:hypothetical protein
MSFESAQRLYDLQTDENGFIEEEEFDQAFSSESDEEADEVERIYEEMKK